MRTKLVVIQPTPFCNINCRYCYLPHRSVNRQIQVTTLEQIRLGLNPEEVEGCHEYSSLHTSAGIEQYKHFLKRLIVLNEQRSSFVPIREVDVLLQHIKSGQVRTQTDTNIPMTILSFDYAGNISTFSPELASSRHPVYGNFTFGNVFDTSLEDIFINDNFLKVHSLIQQGITKCQESCAYFSLCGGGAPSSKLHENGTFDSAETNDCRLRIQVTADVLLDHLEERYSSSKPSKK